MDGSNKVLGLFDRVLGDNCLVQELLQSAKVRSACGMDACSIVQLAENNLRGIRRLCVQCRAPEVHASLINQPPINAELRGQEVIEHLSNDALFSVELTEEY